MKRKKYILIPLLAVGLVGAIFVSVNASKADEVNEKQNPAALVDTKTEVVTPSDDSEEIIYRELTDSDLEKNIHLNLRVEEEVNHLERISDIAIEKQEDMEMIQTMYRNTETGNRILVAQSTNELGNVEDYIGEIKNKWYEGEQLEELLVEGHPSIIRTGSEDESGLYVVTSEYVYSFIGDSREVLLEFAQHTPFK